MDRRHLLVAATALSLEGQRALAQTVRSDRPIRLLVGFAPGGTADLVARLLAQAMQAELGQTIVIENRSGAAGMIALQEAARAAPDGGTFAYANVGQIVLTPLLQPGLADPLRELIPVSHAVNIPFFVGISSRISATTLPDFVTYAQARPGELNYGSSGVGQMTHVAVELLRARTGMDLTHVPYRSGTQAVQELAAGRIQLAMEAYSVLRGPEEAGQARILAVAATRRSALAPAVPTTSEAGVPDYSVSGWQGFFAPSGLPTSLRDRFASAARRALDSAPVREAFLRQGFEAGDGESAEFANFVGAEAQRWGTVIRQAGITAG